MPLSDEDARHLLRRTEVVDDPSRVADITPLTRQQAVDQIVDGAPQGSAVPTLSFGGADSDWERGVASAADWMNRMVPGAGRRVFNERMAFFWHGHLCSEFNKAGGPYFMRDQIDLFRRTGVDGTVPGLMKDMAIQAAMLRYLDNHRNVASSPQQNFARELMELFCLGVGNYTEADVEAATDAWTGHGFAENGYDTGTYAFSSDDHVAGARAFLGRSVNVGGRRRLAGNDTIDTMFGTNGLPSGVATDGPRAGTSTDVIAADFLSRKLWQEFGEADSGTVPSGVATAMRDALLTTGFQITPWVKAMLMHDDFYAASTKAGLVRQPVEYGVALAHATDLSADRASPNWLMDRAGQRPLFPPNVSGWKPNGYWVNAAAMEARNRMVENCEWRLKESTWDGDNGYVRLPGGNLSKLNLYFPPGHPGRESYETHAQGLTGSQLVDRLVSLMNLPAVGAPGGLSTADRARIAQHVDSLDWWMRFDAFLLVLIAPEMHLA